LRRNAILNQTDIITLELRMVKVEAHFRPTRFLYCFY